ncbi:hypothetical protein EB796_014717 [Bugula neritina]|uniref:Uncharacterized protein n=1 Tax=Bugula neritina TaxID=10212 RepID=A0A7J7JMY6_BUGNE|nr:hypothetical protein EB796_014717 [Bugula neritina]
MPNLLHLQFSDARPIVENDELRWPKDNSRSVFSLMANRLSDTDKTCSRNVAAPMHVRASETTCAAHTNKLVDCKKDDFFPQALISNNDRALNSMIESTIPLKNLIMEPVDSFKDNVISCPPEYETTTEELRVSAPRIAPCSVINSCMSDELHSSSQSDEHELGNKQMVETATETTRNDVVTNEPVTLPELVDGLEDPVTYFVAKPMYHVVPLESAKDTTGVHHTDKVSSTTVKVPFESLQDGPINEERFRRLTFVGGKLQSKQQKTESNISKFPELHVHKSSDLEAGRKTSSSSLKRVLQSCWYKVSSYQEDFDDDDFTGFYRHRPTAKGTSTKPFRRQSQAESAPTVSFKVQAAKSSRLPSKLPSLETNNVVLYKYDSVLGTPV